MVDLTGTKSQRLYAIKLDGTRITFECSQGHRQTKDYGKGPVSKRMSGDGLAMMYSWWSRANGGCYGLCTKCRSERRKELGR